MSVKNISVDELREKIRNNSDNLEIIDVREPNEYALSHIKGSRLMPAGKLLNRMKEIDWNSEVFFVCRSGARSGAIADAVSRKGKDVNNLESGIIGFFGDKSTAEFLESDNT